MAVISFKAGAFAPGVPVQPVAIRYPSRATFDNSWVTVRPVAAHPLHPSTRQAAVSSKVFQSVAWLGETVNHPPLDSVQVVLHTDAALGFYRCVLWRQGGPAPHELLLRLLMQPWNRMEIRYYLPAPLQPSPALAWKKSSA